MESSHGLHSREEFRTDIDTEVPTEHPRQPQTHTTYVFSTWIHPKKPKIRTAQEFTNTKRRDIVEEFRE